MQKSLPFTLSFIGRLLPLLLNTRNKQRLMILIYHRVLSEPDFMRPSEPDVLEFSWHMKLIARHFHPLGLQEALQRVRDGSLPSGAVCVTFDDGYADNAELALPVLKHWNIPATVFVATAFLNGGIMWNDVVVESLRRVPGPILDLSKFDLGVYPIGSDTERLTSARAILVAIKHMNTGKRRQVTEYVAKLADTLPDNLMLSDHQVRELHAQGIEIGAHTHSHPILLSLTDAEAREEILRSKRMLEALTNAPVLSFAYPNGRPGHDFSEVHTKMLGELGFSTAVTTSEGVAHPGSDPFLIPRFTPWDRSPTKFMTRMLLNSRNPV